jgi:hypothetical protein
MGRLAVAASVFVILAACGGQISDRYVIENEPATLEEIPGTELKRVILSGDAIQRLGIQTSAVTASSPESLAVPSSALWMDVEGVFWVYTNPEPKVYVRHVATVEDDDGETAILSSGPPVGTQVVTVGVPELFGTEVGVGK